MWGTFGRRIHPADAVNHRSNIMDDTKTLHEPRVLNGPISLLNHACLDHANCVTVFAGTDQKYDYKSLQAVKMIKKDTELTICFSEESHLVCRMCKSWYCFIFTVSGQRNDQQKFFKFQKIINHRLKDMRSYIKTKLIHTVSILY